MQFLMLIKIANDTDYEAGKPPPAALEAAMGELIGEWSKTGAFVSAAGLKPTSQAARLRLNRGKVNISDGPFTEAKEVIGGYAIFNVTSKAEIVDWATRFIELHKAALEGLGGRVRDPPDVRAALGQP